MNRKAWLACILVGMLGLACLSPVLVETTSGAPARTTPGDRITGRTFATRSEVIARHGMACTSQPLATQVAVEILKRGGTAVDAAIAANAVLGVVEPTGCGIGGDLFALVWDPKTKRLHGLNASGRSPKRLTLDEFRRRNLTRIPSYGPLPVTVPGCVDGWFELHGRFGRLPMKDLLAPAIGYARDGFPVSELIAYYWERNVAALAPFPNVRDVYAPNGRTPRKGDVFRNPQLAATLEKIAAGGGKSSTGERSRGSSPTSWPGRGLAGCRRFGCPSLRLGGTNCDQLSRLRCLGVAAKRAGAGGPADAEPARRL